MKEQCRFIDRSKQVLYAGLCSDALYGVKKDIKELDLNITTIVEGDEQLNGLIAIITSIPCVGSITAMHSIITTNEFKDIRPPPQKKKIACYAGVVPFRKQSGLISCRTRVSHLANKNIKRLLHLCALGRSDLMMNLYYERKTVDAGKTKLFKTLQTGVKPGGSSRAGDVGIFVSLLLYCFYLILLINRFRKYLLTAYVILFAIGLKMI